MLLLSLRIRCAVTMFLTWGRAHAHLDRPCCSMAKRVSSALLTLRAPLSCTVRRTHGWCDWLCKQEAP